MLVVDLGDLPTGTPAQTGVLVAVGSAADISAPAARPWLEHATLTLSEDRVADARVISVESTAAAITELTTRVEMWPQAAIVCDDVLRAVDPGAPALAGVVTESLGYSTLQSGGEFAAWLAQRGPATAPVLPDPVLADRDGDTLHIRFNRPAAAQRLLQRRPCSAARGPRHRPTRPVGRRSDPVGQRSILLQRW